MSTNLEGFKTVNNKDWGLWVKLVKQAHKENGITLTQPQALMLAKDSYPGKGNVIGRKESVKDVPITPIERIPANPPRRKREKAPLKRPQTYKREPEEYHQRGAEGDPDRFTSERGLDRSPSRDYRRRRDPPKDQYKDSFGDSEGGPRRARRQPVEEDYDSEEERSYYPRKNYEERYYSKNGPRRDIGYEQRGRRI